MQGRDEVASPESITPDRAMDSGFAALRRPGLSLISFQAAPTICGRNCPYEYRQVLALHPQSAQREGRRQLAGVVPQPAIARLGVPKLTLDRPERVLNLGPWPSDAQVGQSIARPAWLLDDDEVELLQIALGRRAQRQRAQGLDQFRRPPACRRSAETTGAEPCASKPPGRPEANPPERRQPEFAPAPRRTVSSALPASP